MRKLQSKGVSWILEWTFFRLPFIAIVAVIIVVIAGMYLTQKLDVSSVRSIIINERLRNTGPYIYQDPEIGRVYPGIIDKDKLTQERLDEFYIYDTKTAAKVCLIQDIEEGIQCVFVNPKQYGWYAPISSFDQFTDKRSRVFVLVKDGSGTEQYVLDTEVVISE